MKYLLITLLLFTACKNYSYDRVYKSHLMNYAKVCLYGHEYISYDRGVAIILNDDGKPIKCEQKDY